MGIVKLTQVMRRMGMLSPRGIYRLIAAICRYGVNMMALLSIAERTYGEQTAIVDDRETLTYRQLFEQSEKLSLLLQEQYRIGGNSKVALLCRNHASLVKAIFALSWAGADVYLLNAEMGKEQLEDLLDAYSFDLVIYDEELTSFIEHSKYAKGKLLSYHDDRPSVNQLSGNNRTYKRRLRRTSSSTIMLLTGGTTGKAKKVPHKPSLFDYLNPFSALLDRLHLVRYHTGYIATPIYHGYGIAILLLFVALGKKVVLTAGFDAAKACALIREHQVQVTTVVPLMIAKMLKHNREDMHSLVCIASGGAELNPKLAAEVSNALGDVLYNLYGTSESGLSIVATPLDLRMAPNTIGRIIEGVPLQIMDEYMNEAGIGAIGQICVKRKKSIWRRRDEWIVTSDIGYRDENGLYFLCGRADDRIVSAGENVYPIELEHVLILHPLIEDVAVVGIPDEVFGQRLKAYIQTVQNADITVQLLQEWLRGRVARYQMPKEIVLVHEIPYTHVGKQDKKRLKEKRHNR